MSIIECRIKLYSIAFIANVLGLVTAAQLVLHGPLLPDIFVGGIVSVHYIFFCCILAAEHPIASNTPTFPTLTRVYCIWVINCFVAGAGFVLSFTDFAVKAFERFCVPLELGLTVLTVMFMLWSAALASRSIGSLIHLSRSKNLE
jgi:hypothetical protein